MTADTPSTSGDAAPTQNPAPADEGSKTIEIPLVDFGDTPPKEGDEVRLAIVSVDQNAGTVTAEIAKEAPMQEQGIKGAANKFDQTEGE